MDEMERMPANWIDYDDHAFLKELGISGMPKGVALGEKAKQEAQDAMARIEARAAGLQSLNLGDATLERLSKEEGRSVEEIRKSYGFFRDVEGAGEDDTCDWL